MPFNKDGSRKTMAYKKSGFFKMKSSPAKLLNFNFGGSQDNSKIKEKTKVTGDKDFSLFKKRGCACGKMKCNC